MRSHTEVAIRAFQCLARSDINVEMINTSEVRVNVVVDGRHGQRALEALQQAFAAAMARYGFAKPASYCRSRFRVLSGVPERAGVWSWAGSERKRPAGTPGSDSVR